MVQYVKDNMRNFSKRNIKDYNISRELYLNIGLSYHIYLKTFSSLVYLINYLYYLRILIINRVFI